jgi:hypothetical protein
MRRSFRALTLGTTLLTAACGGRALSLGAATRPVDRSLILSCVRSVASERGLGEITQSAETMELQAKSTVQMPDEERGGTPTYDVLTVKLAQANKGMRMLVGSASFVLHQLRGNSGSVGTSAPKTEWVGSEPSTRVTLARDAVLTQCGSLGN